MLLDGLHGGDDGGSAYRALMSRSTSALPVAIKSSALGIRQRYLALPWLAAAKISRLSDICQRDD
jgi:hypothetical protein